jgi:hypothetical protein
MALLVVRSAAMYYRAVVRCPEIFWDINFYRPEDTFTRTIYIFIARTRVHVRILVPDGVRDGWWVGRPFRLHEIIGLRVTVEVPFSLRTICHDSLSLRRTSNYNCRVVEAK